MLGDLWSRGVRARSEANELGQILRTVWPEDARVLYALVLLDIKNLQYGDALANADLLVRTNPTMIEGRIAQAWLLAARNRHAESLEAVRRAAEALAEVWKTDGSPTDLSTDQRDAAERIGRLMAYLQGPVGDSFPGNTLANAYQQMVTSLEGPLVAPFTQGHKQLSESYRERLATLDVTRDEAQAQEIMQQQIRREQLTQEKASMEQSLERLSGLEEQASSAMEQRLGQLDGQLRPIQQQLSVVEGNRARLLAELRRYQADVNRLLLLAETATDPFERDYYLREADRATALARRVESSFVQVDAEFGTLARQADQLAAERNATLQRAEQERRARVAERTRLEGTLRRIARDETRELGPATGNRALSVRDARARLRALPQYDPFPVERERSRLLESL
jgi:hypothetical protein